MIQPLFTLGGIFFVLTALSLHRAVGRSREASLTERLGFAVLTVPLALACATMLWVATHQSSLRPWANGGFGPDWSCLELPRLASDVCFRRGRDQAGS